MRTHITRLTLPLVALALVLVAASLAGCHPDESHASGGHHNTAPAELQVTRPLREDVELTRSYVAQIEASQHIELRAFAHGYLQEVFVDEGQSVAEDAPMFQIVPALYDAEKRRADAESRFAKIEYENTKLLKDGDVVSANELRLAKARFDKANAESALANAHLKLTTIRAPFSGIMDRLHVRKGSLLEEGELLTTLSDISTIWVYFNVTEAEYLDYKLNHKDQQAQPVRLMMANQQLFAHPGTIQTIKGEFNNETGTIAFRAAFPNPDGLLRHGETGNVLMSTPIKGALIVPQKATFEILDKRFVFVVDADNTVHSRQIEVSAELPHLYVVSKGLTEADTILVEGLRKVREGSQVIPKPEDLKKILAAQDVHAE